MFKMGLHDPFGHLKQKLWPKERLGIKFIIWLLTNEFDSWPIKVKNCPDFLPCRWHAIYCWKDLDESYNFALNLTSIEVLHTKLYTSKVVRVLILRISGLPLWSVGTKCHLGDGPMARHRVYNKGEGGGFHQVWVVFNLVSPSLFVVRPCTKRIQITH
jgi:hypothetical protein